LLLYKGTRTKINHNQTRSCLRENKKKKGGGVYMEVAKRKTPRLCQGCEVGEHDGYEIKGVLYRRREITRNL
jgi:hypothetical protein